MGNPIKHSLSPRIHAAFAEQTKHAISYGAILVEINGFDNALQKFRRASGKGLNITVPFKQAAWVASGQLTERAEQAQAVNTLSFQDGKIYGDNTDGVGLIRDLVSNHHVVIAQRNILILGAGGAVSGVLGALLNEQPASVMVANRTVSRARQLVERFAKQGNILYSSYEALADQQFDIIINGTSASLRGTIPPLPENILATTAICYDMMYANTDTPFVAWSRERAAKQSLDGLGMLVEQAAESFFIWRGIRPDTAPVIGMLRN